MSLPKSSRMLIVTFISLVIIFSLAFATISAIGKSYQDKITSQQIIDNQNQLNQEKYDIRHIRLENENGEVIDIFQNGTLIRDKEGKSKQAVLGFNKLKALFSSLSEEELLAMQSTYGSSDSGYTLTIETASGNTYVIHIDLREEDVPDELEELIDDIIDTTEDTLDPTPPPTPGVTPTPSNNPLLTPSPNPTPTPGLTPTPTPTPEANPSPTPSELPAYMTAPMFDCSDYGLVKKTVISNIVCDPAP